MLCGICKQVPDAIVRYDDVPFINGKYYDIVCHTCHCVLKNWDYDTEGNIIYYGFLDPNRLADVSMLVREGWDQQQAMCSINAIKRLVKNMEYSVHPKRSIYIIKQLYDIHIELC